MHIALVHKHYSAEHLAEVKAEMVKRGAPVIRAIWSEPYGTWFAVEGCHRIRAAYALGLTPTIKDISGQKRVRVQRDGDNVRMSVAQITDELTKDVWGVQIISFSEE